MLWSNRQNGSELGHTGADCGSFDVLGRPLQQVTGSAPSPTDQMQFTWITEHSRCGADAAGSTGTAGGSVMCSVGRWS